jgi:hypothetical protein
MSMSGGFPVVPSLLEFGPRTLKNEGAPLNPEKEVSAEQFNLWKWQLAGCGIAVAKAWVVVSSAGARVAAGAVWNPKGLDALHPATAQTATGIYTVTWNAEYPDEQEVDRAITLYGGMSFPQSTTANLVGVASISGTVCTVKITAGATAVATDAQFLLAVL